MYNIMAACDPGTEPYESWEALDDPSVSGVCTIFSQLTHPSPAADYRDDETRRRPSRRRPSGAVRRGVARTP